ncbi:DUF1353 domain-containing protein [Pseudomonas gingeri]|uniref:DUF1353 domain-containing protein n=1 Tax=Pseudomonas gingeri TaxID=117681 RepID=UPI0015A07742|nr:DUF1353 domain-containing protein [Pseudomonas gingeri]NWA11954.1 DUF1353 domain-containing protein [Pseudomonas gingeri]
MAMPVVTGSVGPRTKDGQRNWGFTGELLLRACRAHDSNELWSLLEQLSFTDRKGRTFTAPKGMVTDLASIPAVFKTLFAGIDHRLAGAIHDALYLFAMNYRLTRVECDQLFGEMCECLGASGVLKWMAETGLRVGGWHSWEECRTLGVRWGDFDTSRLSAQEISDYRLLYDLDRFAS